MKKTIALTLALILLFFCTICFSSCNRLSKYPITNIDNYGEYDDCVGKRETHFFPELDKSIMSNFRYSFNKDCIIDCAHEIYLEFNIENEDKFATFISEHQNSIIQEYENVIVQEFMYDKAYTEVVIEDNIRSRYADDGKLVIDYAYIKKFLYNKENNSVIFINLYVMDYWEFENSTYIERFNIDTTKLKLNR